MAKRSPRHSDKAGTTTISRWCGRFLSIARGPAARIELDLAIAVIDSLIAREDLDLEQEDYLDVLGDLVYKYEAEHNPLVAVSTLSMVRFLADSNEMTQTELAQRSGIAESTISAILAGKRKLSRRHIAALSRVFRVSTAVFFPEAEEMTDERVATVLSRRSGLDLSRDLPGFACQCLRVRSRSCLLERLSRIGRGQQTGHAHRSHGKSNEFLAGRTARGSQLLCGSQLLLARFVAFSRRRMSQALADAFSVEPQCWRVFREMVEEAVPEMRAIQREIAEEN